MKLNVRARTSAAEAVAAAPIDAIVALSYLSGPAGASVGVVRGGSSIFGTRYAVDRGIDLNDRRLRTDLLQAWCALTPTDPEPATRAPPKGSTQRLGRSRG